MRFPSRILFRIQSEEMLMETSPGDNTLVEKNQLLSQKLFIGPIVKS